MRDLLAFLSGVAILAAIWGGILFLGRKRRTPGRMKADPVDTNLPRVQRERVTDIDAEYGTDYRGPGRHGERFFAPGGVMFLVSLVLVWILAYWLKGYIVPIADWLVPAGRSPN